MIRILATAGVLAIVSLGVGATAQASDTPGTDSGSWSEHQEGRQHPWWRWWDEQDHPQPTPPPAAQPTAPTTQPTAPTTPPTAPITQPTATTTTPTTAPTPTSSQPAGQTLNVYLTGYGYWDNTPAGSTDISDPVIHQQAAGTGTYDDPITAAVPYHCADGCLQWPAGTKFYLPSLKRYLIVEDTCGDGGADSCPDSNDNHIDVWVGGASGTQATSDACEEGITGDTTAILNPAAGLAVTPGDIC
jgi:hypothetical protein